MVALTNLGYAMLIASAATLSACASPDPESGPRFMSGSENAERVRCMTQCRRDQDSCEVKHNSPDKPVEECKQRYDACESNCLPK